ncbi:MAG: 4Fe-4S dicluster domain-containing protein [Pseudomonadota bacterium]
MEQNELREWERRCIQEEPPECVAACPLHLDARALCGQAAAGRWDQAWAVLMKAMPLPGLLARICDAPCEARCKRAEAGEAIRIGLLERAVTAHPVPRLRLSPLPRKSQKVAVLGDGLAGLTAAWDLARKGYPVALRHAGPTPGFGLTAEFPALTPEVIAAEAARLAAAGVSFVACVDLGDPACLAAGLEQADAVLVDLAACSGAGLALTPGPDGALVLDPALGATSADKVFAALVEASPVWRTARGRWAAASLDRRLQKVSLTVGREKEGPQPTRLFTSLAGVGPSSAVAPANPAGYGAAEASAEAARCLNCQCLECVKVCAYLERFGSYPRKYAREIYNNASIVMGMRLANKLVNSCSLCGLCQAVCPEDFAMQDLALEARRDMVKRGKMPPSAHEFALLDLDFSQGPDFSLARHQPGHETSAAIFFPGCQLSASAPAQVEAVYQRLMSGRADGVGLMLGCCGAPALWAGEEARLAAAHAQWQAQWESLGRPQIIAACTTCLKTFAERLPAVETVSLWQALDLKDLAAAPAGPLTLHDPCTSRHLPAVRQAVRDQLARLGVGLTELALTGEHTECCGFGGLMANANPDLATEVARRRGGRGGGDYIAYCAMCRDSLAGAGKRCLHLLDLVFPPAGVDDPAARPRPGWSMRRENRSRLRRDLLRRLWGEEEAAVAEIQAIKLSMSPEVAERLEARRILLEDLRAAIAQAERSGEARVHPETGHRLAAHRPLQATFWVEYAPAGDGYEVFNAYSHRMYVVGGGRL